MKDVLIEMLAIFAFVGVILFFSGGIHCNVEGEHYHLQLYESDQHGIEVNLEKAGHESEESTS